MRKTEISSDFPPGGGILFLRVHIWRRKIFCPWRTGVSVLQFFVSPGVRRLKSRSREGGMSHSLRTLGFSIFVLTLLSVPSTWAAEVMTPGDLNLDSVTNHDDFFQLLMDYDPSGPSLAPEADSNGDLRVNHADIQAAILGRLQGNQGVPTPEPSQTGAVTGVVLEDVGDALVVIPIAGATVWIASKQGTRLKTTSGEDGTFHFEEVPAGSARITARHQDYHMARASIVVVTGEENPSHPPPGFPE